MTWTRITPIIDGWYWYRDPAMGDAEIVHVLAGMGHGELVAFVDTEVRVPAEELTGEYWIPGLSPPA
jgi:hypothetical protein